jgi:uncharacterized membrane protein
MSDQGWNAPGSAPQDPQQGGWGQTPPPPQQPDPAWGQAPPPPQPGAGWGQPGAATPPAAPPAQGPPVQAGWGQPPAVQPPAQPGQWGQPPQQQWGQPPGAAGSGLDPKIAGILAYVPFGWIGGLVIYLVNKDPLSRFHGAQSILMSIAAFAFFIAVTILQIILPLGLDVILGLLSLLVWLGVFALSVYLAIQGYNLKKVTLPVIGPIAEQWATK